LKTLVVSNFIFQILLQYLFVAFWYGVFWKWGRFGNMVFGREVLTRIRLRRV